MSILTKNETIIFSGISGTKYEYIAYPIDSNFKPLPANYIFAKRSDFGFHPIYIGETSDLSTRFDNHHKLPLAELHGAAHTLVHINATPHLRLSEERDLIDYYKPVCNG